MRHSLLHVTSNTFCQCLLGFLFAGFWVATQHINALAWHAFRPTHCAQKSQSKFTSSCAVSFLRATHRLYFLTFLANLKRSTITDLLLKMKDNHIYSVLDTCSWYYISKKWDIHYYDDGLRPLCRQFL